MAESAAPPLRTGIPGGAGSIAVRQILLLVGLAAAIAAGIALALWSQGTNYSTLYSGLAERDVSSIVSTLEASDIPYELDPVSGGVMVPAARVYEVRMQLASAGLPRGSSFGIQDLPEQGGFGQSAFIENALYVRAREAELEKTISTLQPVESARVHLAIPPQSSFVRSRRQSSASVVVVLFPGRRLENAQVQAIVNLVATSLPDLAPSAVTVVDQRTGMLTGGADNDEAKLTNSQFEYADRIESNFERRITDLVEAVVGVSRVRASVAAEIDFTVNEQTSENFDPATPVVRTEQTDEQINSGSAIAQGIPGALSNQPPENLDAQNAAVAGELAEPPTSTSRSASRNFEIDRTISLTRQAQGQIQRLSVAVLIDNKAPPGGRGDGTPLTEEELGSLTQLVQQAVGFDAARGDTISVVNSAFQQEAPLAAPVDPPLWEQPMFWDIARLAIGAILVIVLALVVLKPIVLNLIKPQMNLLNVLSEHATAQLSAAQQQAADAPTWALPARYEDRMAAARGAVGQDPRKVAQVVSNWVADDNG
jgi:flagellar M-ring protein FliF